MPVTARLFRAANTKNGGSSGPRPGAGDGNRTRVPSLEGWWSAGDLHRHSAGLCRLSSCRFCVCFNAENDRLSRVRIPIRFRGVSRASTLWAYLWARIRSGGRWRYSLRKASRFFQLKTIKNSRAHRVDFYSGSSSPYAQSALFCLGAGSGIPPAAGMTDHA